MQSLIILTPSLLPAWPCGPSNPAQLQRRCLTRSRIRPEPYTSIPVPATPQRLISQPDLNLAPQSSPLEAAVKSEPAFDAESCGAKSTVPPKRGFIKAVPYYTIADQHTVKRQTHCTMYTRAVVHMQGSCACSAEVLPTCDASPARSVCAPWQLETSEQKTTQVKAVEQKTKETKAEEQNPQVSPPSHAPQSNHLDTYSSTSLLTPCPACPT